MGTCEFSLVFTTIKETFWTYPFIFWIYKIKTYHRSVLTLITSCYWLKNVNNHHLYWKKIIPCGISRMDNSWVIITLIQGKPYHLELLTNRIHALAPTRLLTNIPWGYMLSLLQDVSWYCTVNLIPYSLPSKKTKP